jgi:hypothetical protein
MRHRDAAARRLWFRPVLALLAGPAFMLLVLVIRGPGLVDEFQTIRPGMTYAEVQAVLVQPHVSGPLARSFGTPNSLSAAVLRGEPSFEKQEWGRVDNPSHYELEWARIRNTSNGRPASAAERRRYTVRQWGVANTQSYAFIAVFDDKDVVVCRYWTVPAESRFAGRVRRLFGL